jgi:hypothetical protein
MAFHTNPTKEPYGCVSPYSITGVITDTGSILWNYVNFMLLQDTPLS